MQKRCCLPGQIGVNRHLAIAHVEPLGRRKQLKLPGGLQLRILCGRASERRKVDWRKVRRGAFLKRYDKVLTLSFRCVDCGEPIAFHTV